MGPRAGLYVVKTKIRPAANETPVAQLPSCSLSITPQLNTQLIKLNYQNTQLLLAAPSGSMLHDFCLSGYRILQQVDNHHVLF